MKPGDIIERKDGSAVHPFDTILMVIDGKADIEGCILVKDGMGEVRCINPALFKVKTPLEERVAKKMLDPEQTEGGDDTVKTGFGDSLHRYVERMRIDETEEM